MHCVLVDCRVVVWLVPLLSIVAWCVPLECGPGMCVGVIVIVCLCTLECCRRCHSILGVVIVHVLVVVMVGHRQTICFPYLCIPCTLVLSQVAVLEGICSRSPVTPGLLVVLRSRRLGQVCVFLSLIALARCG